MIKRTVYGTFTDLMKIVKKAKKVGYDHVELDDMGVSIHTVLESFDKYGIKPHRGYDMGHDNGWYRNYWHTKCEREVKENAFRLVVFKL